MFYVLLAHREGDAHVFQNASGCRDHATYVSLVKSADGTHPEAISGSELARIYHVAGVSQLFVEHPKVEVRIVGVEKGGDD